MQQRQLRLGDNLDDYCPRERRVTNHAIVAMVGAEVKQTRCTTCEAEHEYKQAKMPRLRRKTETPAALSAHGLVGGPKLHEPAPAAPAGAGEPETPGIPGVEAGDVPAASLPDALAAAAGREHDAENDQGDHDEGAGAREDASRDEGPVHRPLIRASLPRQEGHPPPARPATDFTIRQPTGRQNRFRPRHQQGGGGQSFQGNRGAGGNGNFGGGSSRGGGHRPGGRPPHGPGPSRHERRHDPGRKRSR